MNTFALGCSRHDLRRVFQPSRLLLAVVRDAQNSRYNVLALAFNMWSSYKPLMMTIAVECRSYSSTLFEQEDEFCLAVPGERLAREVLFCGTHSGRDLDKAKACGLQWEPPHRISTPGVRQAIANLEMRIVNRVPSGDHTLIVAEVLSIAMADNPEERALLSIGPATEGYEVLAESGQHVLGVAARGVRESGLRRDE